MATVNLQRLLEASGGVKADRFVIQGALRRRDGVGRPSGRAVRAREGREDAEGGAEHGGPESKRRTRRR